MVVLCVETPMLTNMLSQRQNCNWNGWVNILSLRLKTHLLYRNYNHRNLSCTGFYVSTIIYPKGPFSSVNKLFHRNFLEILLMTFSLYLPYCGSLLYMGVQFPITKCKSKYPMDQCSTVTTNMSQCFLQWQGKFLRTPPGTSPTSCQSGAPPFLPPLTKGWRKVTKVMVTLVQYTGFYCDFQKGSYTGASEYVT